MGATRPSRPGLKRDDDVPARMYDVRKGQGSGENLAVRPRLD